MVSPVFFAPILTVVGGPTVCKQHSVSSTSRFTGELGFAPYLELGMLT